jgi:hypothetical protein
MQLPVKKLSSSKVDAKTVLQEEDGKSVEIPSPEIALVHQLAIPAGAFEQSGETHNLPKIELTRRRETLS